MSRVTTYIRKQTRKFVLCACAVIMMTVMLQWLDPHGALQRAQRYSTSNSVPTIVPLRVSTTNKKVNTSATTETKATHRCPNVLKQMLDGKWVPNDNVTAARRRSAQTRMAASRAAMTGGVSLQRPDGQCGLWVEGTAIVPQKKWHFPAVCEASGALPCCMGGRCMNRTVVQCLCKDCIDMRQEGLHQSLADWIPKEKDCKVDLMSQAEACRIVSQFSRILFIGDSLIRGLHVTLINFLLATLRDKRGACTYDGYHKLSCKLPKRDRMLAACRRIDANIMLRYQYVRLWFGHETAKVLKHMEPLLRSPAEKSVVLIGIGTHDHCNVSAITGFFATLLQDIKQRPAAWPRIVWSTPHTPGILTPPAAKRLGQTVTNCRELVRNVSALCERHHVDVFDNIKLTAGVVSRDGTHHSDGHLPYVKVHVLLHYLRELSAV